MSLSDDIQDQARKAAGKAWATAVELNELAVDAALIDLGDVKTAFDVRFVARLDEHINTIAAATGEKRKAVDDGNNPRQPCRVPTPIVELRVAVGELVDDVLGGEEDDVQWDFWTASRLADVRELIKTWLEVYHVAPLHVLQEFQHSSSPLADADSDDDERTPYPSSDDDDNDELSPLSTSASPPAALAVPSDSSPASSPRDDLDSSSDMELSSPPSSPGLELTDEVHELRVLRTLDELASFVSEPAQELADVDIDVPAADALDGLLTHLDTALASWQTLMIKFDQPLGAKDFQALRPATKSLSGIPAENLLHVEYDVAYADEFPFSPRSRLCARIGAHLGALCKTADLRGPYHFVKWLDVLDSVADGDRLTRLKVATLNRVAPNAEVLSIRAALTDTHPADFGRTLQALSLDQRSGDDNWAMARLESTLSNLRADQIPIVVVRAPVAGTMAVALAAGFARGQPVNAVTLIENRNLRRLSLAQQDKSWVFDELSPESVVELVNSSSWQTITELTVSKRLSEGFVHALYEAPPRALEVLQVFVADDSPDPPEGNFLAPLVAQAWVRTKLTTLILTATVPDSLTSSLLPHVDLCVAKRPTIFALDVARFVTHNDLAKGPFHVVLQGVDIAEGLAQARKLLPNVNFVSDRVSL
ncbi:hypothetical protein EXIGLDRAFT_773653 [Exidia glandulosa HHB12029]|uniref:Uncharacterized protein n=1 Tax=Exidia glandulosa HHB12029 TaxID=1314781 RepID=A0A165EQ19_EXIGL|nr:hypothetical protein EXIGLDRAFT_773653 [Exidia glandulosa HHB12029]